MPQYKNISHKTLFIEHPNQNGTKNGLKFEIGMKIPVLTDQQQTGEAFRKPISKHSKLMQFRFVPLE